jgi:hypothetical protein
VKSDYATSSEKTQGVGDGTGPTRKGCGAKEAVDAKTGRKANQNRGRVPLYV